MAETLSEVVQVRMPPESLEKLRTAARREYLKPGTFVRQIIMRELERIKGSEER